VGRSPISREENQVEPEIPSTAYPQSEERLKSIAISLKNMARPTRFERVTFAFGGHEFQSFIHLRLVR
jgi:hypothetical protein